MTVIFISKIDATTKGLEGEGWYVCENGLPSGKPFQKKEDAEFAALPIGSQRLREWIRRKKIKGNGPDTPEDEGGSAPPAPQRPASKYRP